MDLGADLAIARAGANIGASLAAGPRAIGDMGRKNDR